MNDIISHPCEGCPGFNNSFLKVLEARSGHEFKKHATPITVEKDKSLLNRYSDRGMLCIRSGILKLCYDSKNAGSVTVGYRTSGDAIGHYGVVRNKNIFTVCGNTVLKACFFPKELIKQQCEKNPELLTKINSLVAEDLEEISECLSRVFLKSANQRIAHAIISLKEKFGLDAEDNLAITLTRQEMAGMTGTSIESVFRALAFFKKKRWIEVKKHQIRLLNEEKLRVYGAKKEMSF